MELDQFEKAINRIPLAVDVCEMCKIHIEHNGYDYGHRLKDGAWQKGKCENCCWFYDSNFEVLK